MKKLLAMLLSLVMLFALVPFTFAEDAADFTLVIKGGETTENLDENGNLAVKVFLNGTVEEPLFGLTFGLTYDPEQLTFVDFDGTDAFDMPGINATTAGTVRCAFASVNGIEVAEEIEVITLHFAFAEDLEPESEIAFALVEGGHAETGDAMKPVEKSIGADFTPFVFNAKQFTGIVKFNEGEVEYNGETPYVVWDHVERLHEPAFTVYDEDGETVVDPENYDFEYKENDKPGTGYLFVYFKNAYTGQARLTFKIYLPATTVTSIACEDTGIRITWEPVEDAAGYVIYRRAMNAEGLATGTWTAFARWDNTTELNYLDGHDEAHKLTAGTRYQYGIKAYFERRHDPIADADIGGNVNEPSGNYNLGLVSSPMKTMIWVTPRTLNSVVAGNDSLTIKWTGSKVYTGYQIQIATNATFTQNSWNFKIADPTTYSTVITTDGNGKALIKGKTYYVRLRSYQEITDPNTGKLVSYPGAWTEVLSDTVGKPEITTQPANKSVTAGTSVTFKVVAKGDNLTYQWYYSKNSGTSWTKWSGKTESSFTVKASTTNNGCMYRCVVTNTYGEVTSNAAKLTVK